MSLGEDSKLQGQSLPSDAGGAKDETTVSNKPADVVKPTATESAPATKTAPTTDETVSATIKSQSVIKTAPAIDDTASTTTKPESATKTTPATDSTTSATQTTPTEILEDPKDGSDDSESSLESSDDKSVFIAVMGQTGAGKSSFINWVTGADLEVGHGLRSRTKVPKPVHVNIEGRDVTLVDTPGFDDTVKLEGEILNLIAAWLKLSHERNNLLSGVIFLHRITDNRMGAASIRTMMLLQKICGEENFKNIALVTTKWDELKNQEVGESREKELKTEMDFWGPMTTNKAQTFRHFGRQDTAMTIVKEIIQNHPVALAMQEELSKNVTVVQTAAGGFIEKCLLEEKKSIEENPIYRAAGQETKERIDRDMNYMKEPINDLLAKAWASRGGNERDKTAVPGEVVKDNGALEPPNESQTEKSFLQKLVDLIKWVAPRYN